ncbi:hypothetical protein A8950_0914 [Dongia mobilis]|uniref:2-oxoglutarate-Fe(II)-dependent oxygenase superfamily protein n=1 Tax=Dongia mobilis TaxID=578943 RepID=A0A4R6WY50_9PROT|nr:hypothetical protein [Dongia mobilis]TDQ84363.1 hypothetical protein A8950_0914 [Dongia mobilis]
MFSDVKFHLIYRIANAQIRTYPFAHIYVTDVFPAGFFQELRRNLPAHEEYAVLADTGRVGTGYSRARLSLFPSDLDKTNLAPAQRDFWRHMFETLGDGEFSGAVFNLFRPYIEGRFRDTGKGGGRGLKVWHETFLMRDMETYSLGPHTDNITKLVSMLFYLAEDDSSQELGTALYVPKDRRFTQEGGPHLDFEDFDHVYTAPYAPNVVVSFPKTAACFHGVEPVKGPKKQRDILFFDLKGKLEEK